MSDHPSIRTPEIAASVCEALATGLTLRAVCAADGMPSESAIRRWALEDQEFGAQYAQARARGYEVMADDLLNIADDGTNDYVERTVRGQTKTVLDSEHVQRSKLRLETRQWLLSKALPKLYGEKRSVELSGPDGGPIVLDDHTRAAKINALFAAAARIRDNCEDLV